ncbi:hypothetical protein MKK69_04585 [Methylobacterium sp. J-026]|uniref:hypothetical protein n=1 Tax=Methylobacterium sp. J-026 TaxID=2836624 RepID=UPI001FB9E36F|nr:hypothetical protein [Methylobacterium sp. J-026]MCJ2133345.1 hypothetical protein [Methylobacterium sp. J-026]
MGSVIPMRPHGARPWPPEMIRVGIDFSRWCISFYRAGKLYRRASFDGEQKARAEAAALVRTGRFELGPDLEPCITYYGLHDDDGDCA